MYSKITNPETNRKISIHSKKGTEIINNYMNILYNKIGGGQKGQKQPNKKEKAAADKKKASQEDMDLINQALEPRTKKGIAAAERAKVAAKKKKAEEAAKKEELEIQQKATNIIPSEKWLGDIDSVYDKASVTINGNNYIFIFIFAHGSISQDTQYEFSAKKHKSLNDVDICVDKSESVYNENLPIRGTLDCSSKTIEKLKLTKHPEVMVHWLTEDGFVLKQGTNSPNASEIRIELLQRLLNNETGFENIAGLYNNAVHKKGSDWKTAVKKLDNNWKDLIHNLSEDKIRKGDLGKLDHPNLKNNKYDNYTGYIPSFGKVVFDQHYSIDEMIIDQGVATNNPPGIYILSKNGSYASDLIKPRPARLSNLTPIQLENEIKIEKEAGNNLDTIIDHFKDRGYHPIIYSFSCRNLGYENEHVNEVQTRARDLRYSELKDNKWTSSENNWEQYKSLDDPHLPVHRSVMRKKLKTAEHKLKKQQIKCNRK